MSVFMMIFIAGLIALVVAPWIGYLDHPKMHHTDLMAGDEGDD